MNGLFVPYGNAYLIGRATKGAQANALCRPRRYLFRSSPDYSSITPALLRPRNDQRAPRVTQFRVMNVIGWSPQLVSRFSNWKRIKCRRVLGATLQRQARRSGDAEPAVPRRTGLDGAKSFDGGQGMSTLCDAPAERFQGSGAFAGHSTRRCSSSSPDFGQVASSFTTAVNSKGRSRRYQCCLEPKTAQLPATIRLSSKTAYRPKKKHGHFPL